VAAAENQRAGDEQTDERRAGGHRLSLAEWLVLCLVREKPTHGLVLAGLLDRNGSLGQIWSVPKATVYRALPRLELLGLIQTAGKQPASQGGPARTLVEATPAGRAAAQAWLSTPVEHARAALDGQLRATTGFDRTLVLWRHQAMTATLRFLQALTAGEGSPPES
jgi:DNA-binding PadR family transcriptional regulator